MKSARRTRARTQEWLPWPKENSRSYAAFRRYLDLGPDRKLRTIADQLKRGLNTTTRLSQRWHWEERAFAYEVHLQSIRQETAMLEASGLAANWARRAIEHKEAEWAAVTAGLALARRIIRQILENPFGTIADVSRLLEVCSKIGRLATGLATEREEFTGLDGDPIRIEIVAAIAKVYGPGKVIETIPDRLETNSTPTLAGEGPEKTA